MKQKFKKKSKLKFSLGYVVFATHTAYEDNSSCQWTCVNIIYCDICTTENININMQQKYYDE